MIDLMIVLLALSLVANSILVYSLLKKKKAKDKTPPPEFSDFLLDLMQGGAVLKVQRINPDDLMLRSPRRSL